MLFCPFFSPAPPPPPVLSASLFPCPLPHTLAHLHLSPSLLPPASLRRPVLLTPFPFSFLLSRFASAPRRRRPTSFCPRPCSVDPVPRPASPPLTRHRRPSPHDRASPWRSPRTSRAEKRRRKSRKRHSRRRTYAERVGERERNTRVVASRPNSKGERDRRGETGRMSSRVARLESKYAR